MVFIRKPHPSSLHAQALFLVGGITTLLFTLLIYYHYEQEKRESSEALQTRMQLQANLFAASVSQAMWDFNSKYIHSAAQGVLEDTEVDGVTVRDADGKTVDTAMENPAQARNDELHMLVRSPIEYVAAGKVTKLGRVELLISRGYSGRQLHAYLKVIILEATIFVIFQLILLHLILRYLLDPVHSITLSMLNLAEGRTDTVIPFQQRKDEIGQMSRAIQTFRHTAVRMEELMREVETRRSLQHELEQARQKAEEANTAKSQFLANMSHEIRTPMNGMLGMAHLLLDTNPTLVQKEYIATINHSAQHLLMLLNDILDLSKIEAHELLLEHIAFDIRNNFLETVKLLTPLARAKNVEMTCNVSNEVPAHVTSDPGRFTQIVTNLLGNAVKFTEKGTVEASLHYDPEQRRLRCEVKDTGIGIPQNKQSSIFEKFTQGDASISRKYGGTGLGLTITRQLVVMMGGEIGFKSTPGSGSHFWFTLPYETARAQQPVETRASLRRAGGQKSAQASSILVAEDHPVNQILLVKLLGKYGFTDVDVAENGLEAMEKFRQKTYDAIFMDCQMPEQDGYETTRIIRETDAGNRHVPIIAMTANAMVGDREACLRAGMDDYISKPISPEKLKTTLGQWFLLPGESNVAQAAQDFALDTKRLSEAADTPQRQRELLATFLRLTDDKITVMERSRRSAERAQWLSAAHYIKGAADNLGMSALAERCLQAEQTGASYEEASALLGAIRAEVERVRRFMEEL